MLLICLVSTSRKLITSLGNWHAKQQTILATHQTGETMSNKQLKLLKKQSKPCITNSTDFSASTEDNAMHHHIESGSESHAHGLGRPINFTKIHQRLDLLQSGKSGAGCLSIILLISRLGKRALFKFKQQPQLQSGSKPS